MLLWRGNRHLCEETLPGPKVWQKKSICRSIGGFVFSDSVLAKLATIWIKTRANSLTGHCESVFILKSLYILRYGMFISYLLICVHFCQQHQTINCHWSIYELSMIMLPLPDSSLETTFKRCELQKKKMWKKGIHSSVFFFFFLFFFCTFHAAMKR